MHMADALVSPAVAGAMYACSAAAAAYSIRQVRRENDPRKIPLMGVMGAFVFAAQMLNFTIPGTGSSGHLCGSMLLAALLGPCAGFLAMIGVLAVQCLLFADGGLLALGCNIWNMAFYGCFVGGLLIWRPLMRRNVGKKQIIAASLLGSVLTLQLGAFSVTLETTLSGITALPFSVFLAAMQPIHLAIGLVEGLIVAAVLCFIHDARPQLLYGVGSGSDPCARLSLQKTLTIIAVITMLLGGGLSLTASEYPDGLEWSIAKTAGDSLPAASGSVHALTAAIQEASALLPDYAFKDGETSLGIMTSGIIGSFIVAALCAGSCCLFKFFKSKAL